jgi:AraC-like DNA-binding protein
MPRRAIRPIFVPLVLEYARAEGLDSNELLRRFALPPEIESRSDIEIDLERFNALVDAIATALRDPFLGIHVAVRYRRGTYELLEFACRNSPDVRGAMLRLVRYAAIANPALAFSFTETGSTGALSHRFDGLGRQASEFTMALVCLLARESTGRTWTPDAVWFVHEAPAETGELVSLFGTDRIRFGEDSNGLFIGREALDMPLTGADPALLRVLETEMARHIAAPAASTSSQIVAETEHAVRTTLELGARIELVAKSLRMSVRTLQRRLDDEGTSFQEVVEQTRERLAKHHAERGELSSTQMAFLLGYSDVTAFLRAFKRWTGTSPQEFRGGKQASRTGKKLR